jgi:hypothetical protein
MRVRAITTNPCSGIFHSDTLSAGGCLTPAGGCAFSLPSSCGGCITHPRRPVPPMSRAPSLRRPRGRPGPAGDSRRPQAPAPKEASSGLPCRFRRSPPAGRATTPNAASPHLTASAPPVSVSAERLTAYCGWQRTKPVMRILGYLLEVLGVFTLISALRAARQRDFLDDHGTPKGKEYAARLRKAGVLLNLILAVLLFVVGLWSLGAFQ